MIKQIKKLYKFYLLNLILALISFLIVSNINFGYKNIFYLDFEFDKKYINNIGRSELDYISQIPKNYYISKIKISSQKTINWKNKCEITDGNIRCPGENQLFFNFWNINILPDQIDNITFKKNNYINYEKFKFNTNNYLRHSYETEFFHYTVFDNFEIFKKKYLNNVINFENKKLTKKTLSTFYAQDLKDNFENRFFSINAYNRNDLSNLHILFYIKILIIFIFTNLIIFYFLKIIFKKN